MRLCMVYQETLRPLEKYLAPLPIRNLLCMSAKALLRCRWKKTPPSICQVTESKITYPTKGEIEV